MTSAVRVISQGLVQLLRQRFTLEWRGIHGAAHWARVRLNGLQLAGTTGADTRVVELFSFLHDARRAHDGADRGHGRRAAELARELDGRLFWLGPRELDLLEWACRDHSAGLLDADVTVQTCWDADRLDLGRIGIRPEPSRLCTEAARRPEMIEAAWRRSLGDPWGRRVPRRALARGRP
jgi:uncharacterized protein